MKECKKCGKTKGFDEFGKGNYSDGLNVNCSPCAYIVEKERQKRQKEYEEIEKNIPLGYKLCRKYSNTGKLLGCGKIKRMEDFKVRVDTGKRRGKCKDCEFERNKKYREKNKEKITLKKKIWQSNNLDKARKRSKKWKSKNFEKVNLNTKKRRAKRKGVEENYTYEDRIITYAVFGERCFNCKVEKNLAMDHHRCLNEGNPLTVKNAVPLCKVCNSKKGTKKPEEFYSREQLKEIEEKFEEAEAEADAKAQILKIGRG